MYMLSYAQWLYTIISVDVLHIRYYYIKFNPIFLSVEWPFFDEFTVFLFENR